MKELSEKLPYLMKRNQIITTLKAYLDKKDYCAVETNALQICPGMEVHLEAFKTKLSFPFGNHNLIRYLHTSPEFAMKKLISQGMNKIYQFAHVFRNEELSDIHHPEFTMLEFYATQMSYKKLMKECENLIKYAAKKHNIQDVNFKNLTNTITDKWEYITVKQAFQKYAKINLNKILPSQPTLEPDTELIKKEAIHLGLQVSPQDRFEDIFFKIMLEYVEPHLGEKYPTVLYDYPVCLGALARAKPENPLYAERFEIYICGVEIANGFGELTNPTEQLTRFKHDQKIKRDLYGHTYPIDQEFIKAVGKMPPTSGVAIGIDRLIMLLTHAPNIQTVLWEELS